MTIQVLGTISLVLTKKKSLSYLSGDIVLNVSDELILGGVYACQFGNKYLCTRTSPISNMGSVLRIYSMNLGTKFTPPTSLTFIYSSFSEK